MDLKTYWQYPAPDVLNTLQSSTQGLTTADAALRLASSTKKEKEKPQFVKDILLFISQFKSPLTLLLVAAVILSAFLGETSDVFIILFILLATGIMSFIQERHAGLAVEKLRSLIRSKVKVQRSNTVVNVYSEEIVPGDILLFAAGDIIPADCLLLEAAPWPPSRFS